MEYEEEIWMKWENTMDQEEGNENQGVSRGKTVEKGE